MVGITRERLGANWLVPALLMFGLAIRVVYHLQYSGSIFWGDLSIDEHLHHAWALYIADGNLVGDAVFFRAPLYAYFLALIYWLSGADMHAVLIIQHLVGIATGYLLYRLTKKMFSYTTGVLALAFYVLSPIFVYFEGQLLLDFLILPLTLTAFIFLHRGLTDDRRASWILSGVFFGLAALTRPNVLFFMFFLGIWLLMYIAKKNGVRTALLKVAMVTVVAAAMIAPVTVRNYVLSGDVVLVSSQGGINFYLGNNRDADGVSAYMPGLGFDWEYADCIHIAEEAEGKALSASQVSTYWYKQGIKFALDDPEMFLPLLIKKIYLLVNNHEISNNRDISFVFDKIWIVWILPVSLWILLPLALVGAIARRHNTWTGLLALYILTYSFTILLFFINSRFRLPVLVFLPVLAALGIEALVEAISRKRAVRSVAMFAVILIIAYGTTSNLYRLDFEDHSQEEYNIGNHFMNQGRLDEAVERYHSAIAKRPSMNQVNLNIGNIHLSSGELDSARTYFLRELQIAVDSSKAYNNLGVVERLAHNDSLSLTYLRLALELKPYYVDALINYAITARGVGMHRQALELLDRAIAANSMSTQVFRLRGVLRFDLGQLEDARRDFERSIDLLIESRQPSFTTLSSFIPTSQREIEQTKDEAIILYHLGTIAGRTGSLDSAATLLRDAIRLDSALVEAKVNLTTALVQLGRFNEAENSCENLIESGEDDALLWYLLAVSRLNLDDFPGAAGAVDSALARSPEFTPAVSLKMLLQENTGEN